MAKYVVYDVLENVTFEGVFDSIEAAEEDVKTYMDYEDFKKYQIAELKPVAKLVVDVKLEMID